MLLAERLERLHGERPVVFAISPAVLEAANRIARVLETTCDVLAVRGLHAPRRPGVVVGAIAEGSGTVFDESAMAELGVFPDELLEVVRGEREALKREVAGRRELRRRHDLSGRTAVLVGGDAEAAVTILAAIAAVRGRCDRVIVLALDGGPQALDRLREHADEVIALSPSFGVAEDQAALPRSPPGSIV